MITLDELHKGNIVYQVYDFYWIEPIKIMREKEEYENELARVFNKKLPPAYCVKGLDSNNNTEMLYKMDEPTLFKTFEEAKIYSDNAYNERVTYLTKDNNLIKFLFEKAKKSLPEAERKLCEELINKLNGDDK